jgi:hypothetical protein
VRGKNVRKKLKVNQKVTEPMFRVWRARRKCVGFFRQFLNVLECLITLHFDDDPFHTVGRKDHGGKINTGT